MSALVTTAVGSYPKPDYLARARSQFSQGKLDREELEQLERPAMIYPGSLRSSSRASALPNAKQT